MALAENADYDSVANVADRLYLRDNADYAAGAVTTKMFHTSTEGAKYAGGRDMGFWENENETYPTIAQDTNGDFYTLTVDAAGNSVPVPGASLHGQKVRHHHFPAESTVQNAVGADAEMFVLKGLTKAAGLFGMVGTQVIKHQLNLIH